ncbi:hypothetical protein Micbo1qcDRAFT_210174, partial [Microdochium bolleyi]
MQLNAPMYTSGFFTVERSPVHKAASFPTAILPPSTTIGSLAKQVCPSIDTFLPPFQSEEDTNITMSGKTSSDAKGKSTTKQKIEMIPGASPGESFVIKAAAGLKRNSLPTAPTTLTSQFLRDIFEGSAEAPAYISRNPTVTIAVSRDGDIPEIPPNSYEPHPIFAARLPQGDFEFYGTQAAPRLFGFFRYRLQHAWLDDLMLTDALRIAAMNVPKSEIYTPKQILYPNGERPYQIPATMIEDIRAHNPKLVMLGWYAEAHWALVLVHRPTGSVYIFDTMPQKSAAQASVWIKHLKR